jgi:uncharacterized membrane protein YheB (UPF0754 family)
MEFEPSLLRAVVTIAFGALAGGLTNAVAIWMLFHPYTSRGVGRFKLQGAIPKNKARLAKTIGRTVGERLLTSEDMTRQLTAPGVHEAFQSTVEGFVETLMETERESLRKELPEGVLAELDNGFRLLAPAIAERMSEFAETDDFKTAVARFLDRTDEEIGDMPLGEVLTEARRRAIREQIEQWVSEAATSPGLEEVIGDWLDRRVARWSTDRTPLLDRLPSALVAAVEREIAGYLPMALDRINTAMGDPNTRANIHRSLHRLFESFVNNLLLHERIVARIVVTEKTISRMLDNFEEDGVEQVTRLFEQPEIQSQVARSVNEAVVKFLRKPLADHFEALGHERLEGVKETIKIHMVNALHDSATQRYIMEKVDHGLQAAEQRTWGDLLKYVPREHAADLAAGAITAGRVREWVTEGSNAALSSLLDRPIGKPADWFPGGGQGRLTKALTPPLWEWIQSQVPTVVERLDIRGMVEEKVLGFSLERIEQIVRATTQRELDIIVRLGYVLGAIVGTTAYLVSILLP